jgi:hypothetical protein
MEQWVGARVGRQVVAAGRLLIKYGQSKEFVGHLLQLANARRSQKQLKTVCRALRTGRSGLKGVRSVCHLTRLLMRVDTKQGSR